MVALLLQDIARLCRGDVELIVTLNIPETDPVPAERVPHAIRYIRNVSPKGFGANHNAAARVASGEFYCVLNPDVRLTEDPFPPLVVHLDGAGNAEATVGVIAPRVVDASGLEQDSLRRFPTVFSLFRKLLTRELRADYEVGKALLQRPDWVAGMFMLFRTGFYRSFGGFDEKYFLYYEDVDLCLRLRRSGHAVLHSSEVTIIHDSQRASWKKPRYALMHLSSMVRYLARRHLSSV
jgi:hypothetical protein